VTALMIDTPRGPGRAHLTLPDGQSDGAAAVATAALVLGHGAGGGVAAPDLRAASAAALAAGLAVALVEQPYRVAGRRSPPPAAHLDQAWIAILEQLGVHELAGMAIVTGGRSSGARVACRTAAETGSAGIVCLAFPLEPPRNARSTAPATSRLPELEAVTVPTLVVQGASDRFGMPPAGPSRTVVRVAGDHGLKSDLGAVGEAVGVWLALLTASAVLPQRLG
jgi:predicted alpha/beta-hydrolase family hydrolase